MEDLHQATSSPQTDLETEAPHSKVMFTPQEAIALGMTYENPPPPDDVCQFCGKVLPRQGLGLMGVIVFWQPFPTRCDCAEAVKYWEEYDEAERQRKEAEEQERKQAKMTARIEKLLGDSGIKKRFARRTFKHFITDTPGRKKAYDIAYDYAENFQRYRKAGDGLYIEGTYGTGKTHLAAAIALKLIYVDNLSVICKTSIDMLNDIKHTYERHDIYESEVLDIYKKVDLLVIDDLGKEQASEWSIATLYSIINDRYEDMKPIIVTTNFNAEGLIEALTPRGSNSERARAIVSRLKEVSAVITMAWDDYRTSRNGGTNE